MLIRSLIRRWFVTTYRRSVQCTSRSFTILGIETSCDDTCAAIIESTSKTVLASERLSHSRSQLALSGISPRVAAEQHRSSIDELVDKCIQDSRIRPSELDAIAATTTPGLVICLKVGVDKALAMCRDYKRRFIAVHHMKAHALVARLIFDDVRFPFVALLISGAHSIICVVNGPTNFMILGESTNISPGGAIDKVAREAGINPLVHYGAAVEELAKQSTTEKYLLYNDRLPHVDGADFDFLIIKQLFTTVLQKTKEINLPDFCQNLQLIIAGHLCQKLDLALRFVNSRELNTTKQLIVSGGVAANEFIRQAIEKVAVHHEYAVKFPPKQLVTDNAEMIAWTAAEMLNENANCGIPFQQLPSSVYVHARTPIGRDGRAELKEFSSENPTIPKLRLSSLHPTDLKPLFRSSLIK
ncbi:hypothetical protein M3Y94_00148000 [Aphelenchoides besseyi]|nr:hypothetical protein M3Y94_00148000 [Aphelenchoides besseyi]KAI6237182.1 N(6)-L-threonylcarbamoyladenine synthase [Aphelenchoides besseyi]